MHLGVDGSGVRVSCKLLRIPPGLVHRPGCTTAVTQLQHHRRGIVAVGGDDPAMTLIVVLILLAAAGVLGTVLEFAFWTVLVLMAVVGVLGFLAVKAFKSTASRA